MFEKRYYAELFLEQNVIRHLSVSNREEIQHTVGKMWGYSSPLKV